MRHHLTRQVRAKYAAKLLSLPICLLILSLSVTLATRTFSCAFSTSVSVRTSTAQGMRQHLDRDALQWTPPVAEFGVLEAPPDFYPRFAPAGPPVATALFHKSLYNRPPPSC
jgi:hypothetical protein